MKFLSKTLVVFSLLALVGVAVPAFAATTPSTKTKTTTDLIAKIKDAADREIDRRIEILNKAVTRLNDAKKLSAGEKSALVNKAQQTISDLTTLKAKIDADTDLSVLRTDRKGITENYRVFMLLMPQIHIIAASDRISATVDILDDAAVKLETKISEAKTAGKNVSLLETLLSDMKSKLADAQVKALAAEAAVSSLTPDGGVQSKIDANKAALATSRTDIKTAIADLVAARKDAGQIKDGLAAL